MESSQLTSVAYKKGNWMRYTLWALAAICIGVLIYTFINTLESEVSATVPDGYRFSVVDNYSDGANIRTIYYVYDNKIMVEDESFEKNKVNRAIVVYDNVNTTSLQDDRDTTELCELGACHEVPKVLIVIKNLISRKIGREYIGF